MCSDKQMETWIALAHQDNETNPFWWWSMVALLSIWKHTGMSRLQNDWNTGVSVFKANSDMYELVKIQLSIQTETKLSVLWGMSCNQQIVRLRGH